jgi:hypothetical protein
VPIPTDNPAGRLHAVFANLVDFKEGQSLNQAWARTLGCADGDIATLSARMTEVSTLLNDCSIAARSLQSITDVDTLLWHYPSWTAALFGFNNQNRSAAVSPRQIVSPEAVAALGTLATVLHLHAPEIDFRADFNRDSLAECRTILDELVSEIAEDSLIPESVKSRILRALNEVRRNFDFLGYRGAQALAQSASSAAQFVTLSPQAREECTSGVLDRLDGWAEKTRGFAEKLWSMLAPPVGTVYILTTGDVMGGSMIMAANPRVANAAGTLATAIRSSIEQRQIGSQSGDQLGDVDKMS